MKQPHGVSRVSTQPDLPYLPSTIMYSVTLRWPPRPALAQFGPARKTEKCGR